MNWISTDDRLPEPNILVLIFNPFTFETMHTAKLTEFDGDQYWFFESDDDYLHIRYTSHWMPLPEPPEEKEEG